MKIQENSVVSIHYTLKGEDGAVLDTSDGGEPLNYLQGAGNIIMAWKMRCWIKPLVKK